MARTKTKAFGFYLKQGATLPTPPANFLETSEKLLISATPTIEKYKRYSGKLGANDSYADICDTVVEGADLAHKMRFQNSAADALDTVPDYGELLKIGGFTEVIDTATPNQETVTYTWNTASSPALGSGVYYLDGNKQTMTNSIAANIVFNFEIGKAAMINGAMSAFLDNNGVSIPETNPTATLSTEGCLMVGCLDVYTEEGTAYNPTSISIDMGAQIDKFYGMGLKEYEISDFEPTIKTDFYLDNANYNNAINKLKDETLVNVVIKLGTNAGVEKNGKTVVFTINNVKFSSYSDADNQDNVLRSHELILTATSTFTIKTGYFA